MFFAVDRTAFWSVAIVLTGLACRPDTRTHVGAESPPNQPSGGVHVTVTQSGDTLPRAKGLDSRGIPIYVVRSYTTAERALLRLAFGVDDPKRLYYSDSGKLAILKYDTQPKRCRDCYVDSYRVGFVSIRRPGEVWDAFEKRILAMRSSDFPNAARQVHASLGDLDPRARPAFQALLDSGRRAGFRLTVVETYRTPLREALLFEEGHRRTFTATSLHSYGRAVDISVDDGNPNRAATRANWIRFRRFVVKQADGQFRLVGTVDRTWDWRHIELPAPDIGFHSIDEALSFAAQCTTRAAGADSPGLKRRDGAARDPCVIAPHLPAGGTMGPGM